MIKKVAFITLLIAAIACGIWGYLYLTNLKRPKTNPLSILPDTCFALIETNNLHALTQKLTQGNLMWEEFLKADAIKECNDLLLYVDSLCLNALPDKRFEAQSIYVALYQAKKTIPLVAFNLSDINTNDFFISFLEKNFLAKKTTPNFYACSYNQHQFFVYVNTGFIMLANEMVFLQQAISNHPNNLMQNKLFAQAYQTKDKESDVNLFVHLPFFYQNGWNTLFAAASQNKIGYGAKNEAWLSADVTINPSEMNAQGFLSDDKSVFYTILKNQESVNFKDAFDALPYNISKLQLVSISNYQQFISYCYDNNNEQRKQDLQFYAEKLSADVQIEMEKFAGEYATLFDVSTGAEAQNFGTINFTNEKLASDFLGTVTDSTFRNVDSVKVWVNNESNLFSLLSGKFFSTYFKYIVCTENTFLFGNDVEALVECQKIIAQKNTLSKNERAVNFLDKSISTESSYLFYADVFKSKNEVENAISKKVAKILDQNPDMLTKYEFAALSIEKLKSNLFFKTSANFSPKNKLYQNTLWETLLDTTLYTNPIPVKNHITNETELACVDVNNNLYLLSNTGKILWKKNIGDKVLGQINQVDYFDNNKLQLLFNTKNQLFLMDRNGNNVSGFPVKLAAEAADGLTLFDYEKNKKYRLWIPQKNNTTACYAINGKQLIDFSPIKNAGQVFHIVLQQKDYFVLIDTLGNINVSNRKGEARFKITNKIKSNSTSFFKEEGKTPENTNICYINKAEKKLYKISLTDKLQEISIPIEGSILQSLIDTVQNPVNPLLVYVTENNMQVFDFFGKKLYQTDIDFKISTDLKPLLFKENHVYTALKENTDKLFFLNPENNKITDAEIKLSALPFTYSLINNQKPYLIGFYGNKVFCIKQ